MPRNLKASARSMLEQVSSREKTEQIITSASLPNWNRGRLKAGSIELASKLGCNCAEYKLALICLELLTRSGRQVPRRATFYNDDFYGYSKVGIIYRRFSAYQYFRTKSLVLRASLSHLLDIAVRLYLPLAMALFRLRFLGVTLKSKWQGILERCEQPVTEGPQVVDAVWQKPDG